jgi:hypothetical protein
MALEAKTLGVAVLRTMPNGAQQPFSTALRLAEYAVSGNPCLVLLDLMMPVRADPSC